ELRFPVDLSIAARDHPMLDEDGLESLYRRLEILNRCARFKLDSSTGSVSAAGSTSSSKRTRRPEESDEEESRALSSRWRFRSNRWTPVATPTDPPPPWPHVDAAGGADRGTPPHGKPGPLLATTLTRSDPFSNGEWVTEPSRGYGWSLRMVNIVLEVVSVVLEVVNVVLEVVSVVLEVVSVVLEVVSVVLEMLSVVLEMFSVVLEVFSVLEVVNAVRIIERFMSCQIPEKANPLMCECLSAGTKAEFCWDGHPCATKGKGGPETEETERVICGASTIPLLSVRVIRLLRDLVSGSSSLSRLMVMATFKRGAGLRFNIGLVLEGCGGVNAAHALLSPRRLSVYQVLGGCGGVNAAHALLNPRRLSVYQVVGGCGGVNAAYALLNPRRLSVYQVLEGCGGVNAAHALLSPRRLSVYQVLGGCGGVNAAHALLNPRRLSVYQVVGGCGGVNAAHALLNPRRLSVYQVVGGCGGVNAAHALLNPRRLSVYQVVGGCGGVNAAHALLNPRRLSVYQVVGGCGGVNAALGCSSSSFLALSPSRASKVFLGICGHVVRAPVEKRPRIRIEALKEFPLAAADQAGGESVPGVLFVVASRLWMRRRRLKEVLLVQMIIPSSWWKPESFIIAQLLSLRKMLGFERLRHAVNQAVE
ncbi:unnamed protein product, partial [Cyprideis torosa]